LSPANQVAFFSVRASKFAKWKTSLTVVKSVKTEIQFFSTAPIKGVGYVGLRWLKYDLDYDLALGKRLEKWYFSHLDSFNRGKYNSGDVQKQVIADVVPYTNLLRRCFNNKLF
jgi:hypothetical protein